MYSIYSTGSFGMHGFQVDENHKIIPNGRIRFGGDFILDKGGSYELIIQRLPEGESIKKIELKATSERSARIEINKINLGYKGRNAPDFVTVEKLQQIIAKRDQAIKNGDGLY